MHMPIYVARRLAAVQSQLRAAGDGTRCTAQPTSEAAAAAAQPTIAELARRIPPSDLPPQPPHRWVGEPSPLASSLHGADQLISRQVEKAFAPLVRAILESDSSPTEQ